MDFMFFVRNVLLGVALAMDAFSVSLANGLAEPRMRAPKVCEIAGTFAFFQWFMPMIGWVCVYFFVEAFTGFKPLIPWIALALLLFIGIKMILDGLRGEETEERAGVGFLSLIVQGIATSIDALSTGFTFVGEGYGFPEAMIASLVIAVVTFAICVAGVLLGKKFGTALAGRATVLGGIILVGIGIEIFVTGVFF